MPLRSSRRRSIALAIGILSGLLFGSLVVTGVGLATGSGILVGESDETKALRVLRADQTELARLTDQLAGAQRLDDMHASAQTAERLLEGARGRGAQLAMLEDGTVRSSAERAHRSVEMILASFSELEKVDQKNLDAWNDAEREAISALGELDVAAAPVAALNPERPLRLDSRRVEGVVEQTSTYLTTSARKLARYEKRIAKFRRRNRSRIQAAADYKATVLAQVSAYNQTRDDLQEYLDDAQEFGEQIDAFRSQLQDAKSRRQGIRGTLASLNPPGALQGEHQRIIAVLDHAITATDLGVDLADATQRLRDEGDVYTDGFELPEYDALSEQSEQITRERDAAVSNFNSSIETYLRRLKRPKGAPTRPAI